MRFEEDGVLLVHIRRAEAGEGRAFTDLVCTALLGGEQGYPLFWLGKARAQQG